MRFTGFLAFAATLGGALLPFAAHGQAQRVEIDADAIGGVVTSRFGPEAGVWVIAETTELGTRYAKIVVTDDLGRYVIPDLPKAHYRVWTRGYGLVDSKKIAAEPGKLVDHEASVAPSLEAAAQYYPPIYWLSLLRVPDRAKFPGTGPSGNGVPENFKSQEQWLDLVKTNGCGPCHQLGNYATRTIPPALGHFETSQEAWARRLRSGQAGSAMVNTISRLDTTDGGQLALFADWTDRIKAGELPHETPPRPSGVERNIVVTVREWASPKHYLHDLAITDKRKPTVNAKGLIYGATELGSDDIPVIDPQTNKKWLIDAKVRDADTPSSLLGNPVVDPSPYLGSEAIWNSKFNAHTPTLDETGKIYFAAQARAPKNAPAFCDKTSALRSAQLYPLSARPEGFSGGQRQVTIYDPSTKQFSFIDTCFSSHHLNFAEDANNTLWLNTLGSPDLAVVGWVDTKKFLATGDAAASQGWTPLIVDTNGNGKRDEGYNEPGKPVDPAKDTRVPLNYYSISWSPLDGSVWGSSLAFPGYAVRLAPGANPPETALAEVYKVPAPGYGIRGADVDRKGVFWAALGSGHIASFDRRKCKGPLNGPGAEKGEKCPEGWSFYPLPGPGFAGAPGAAETPYYLWVDQHDILGLGADTPIATGNQSDSLHALVGGRIVELRVPYPLGFYAKGVDGRIDDAKAGWKGRGLWVTSGNRTPYHIEAIDAPAPGAPGATPAAYSSPLVVNFQLRPDPLAH
ncbi:carboxypeptidase-like regulatory domain-containing protein [Methylosinus sp. LW4]|uniref:carboxypeptidase-like regulatory domain-containing protein n=1 Tax=Methylosinus sp. LW4 TaxID=136993 RepID=UPI0003AAC464|nr:carboxypeptidase-like regulatory domain-containing protein [Methylosinus sp. LW4]